MWKVRHQLRQCDQLHAACERLGFLTNWAGQTVRYFLRVYVTSNEKSHLEIRKTHIALAPVRGAIECFIFVTTLRLVVLVPFVSQNEANIRVLSLPLYHRTIYMHSSNGSKLGKVRWPKLLSINYPRVWLVDTGHTSSARIYNIYATLWSNVCQQLISHDDVTTVSWYICAHRVLERLGTAPPPRTGCFLAALSISHAPSLCCCRLYHHHATLDVVNMKSSKRLHTTPWCVSEIRAFQLNFNFTNKTPNLEKYQNMAFVIHLHELRILGVTFCHKLNVWIPFRIAL